MLGDWHMGVLEKYFRKYFEFTVCKLKEEYKRNRFL